MENTARDNSVEAKVREETYNIWKQMVRQERRRRLRRRWLFVTIASAVVLAFWLLHSR